MKRKTILTALSLALGAPLEGPAFQTEGARLRLADLASAGDVN